MENQGELNTARPRHVGGGNGGGGGGGGREDCWSEGATAKLIDAWGDRYLQLNRGNLRQKDWKEVAGAVNARQNGVKPRKTDVQCKNRIDTLKKKYKVEKAKAVPSKWPFYHRLDHLIGTNAVAASNKKTTPSPSVHKPATVTFSLKSWPKPSPNPNLVVYSGGSSSKSRLNSSGSNDSSLGGDGGGARDNEVLFGGGSGGLTKHRLNTVDFSEETAYKELARAILRFGEIYERIESAKQQQMMELEKQRMEFTKELEFQRMNVFMEAQVELEKMRRPANYAPGAGKKL